ncbi:hypothetical protein PIB30_029765 [Stylosanthes scabra]|uniref:UDP-glucuronate decarboxylase n=1 Tax=Stylosanthes scabra TaxID=79078 RepID=A0ABU6RBK8_9FABA|nr:hypothetical protein [Stylosanthes scabra]
MIKISPLTLLLQLILLLFLANTIQLVFAKGTDNVREACKVTRYPNLCFRSLTQFSNTAGRSPSKWARAGVSVTIGEVKHVLVYLARLKKSQGQVRGSRNRAALSDCIETFGDALDELHRSLGVLRKLSKSTFGTQMDDLNTWISAALTDADTCLDGFQEKSVGKEIRLLKIKVIRSYYITSNALALVNKLATTVPKLSNADPHFTIPPHTTLFRSPSPPPTVTEFRASSKLGTQSPISSTSSHTPPISVSFRNSRTFSSSFLLKPPSTATMAGSSELIYRGHESQPITDDYSPKPNKPWLSFTLNPVNYLLREQRLLFTLLGIFIATAFFTLLPSHNTNSPYQYDTVPIPYFTQHDAVFPTNHQSNRHVAAAVHSFGKVPLGIKRKGLRIVVTGGAGFVGSHLVDRLIARGDSVIVVDNFFTGRKENVMHHFGNPRFELIRHDVVEPLLLEVDQIYHLACPASPVHYKFNPVKTIISFYFSH